MTRPLVSNDNNVKLKLIYKGAPICAYDTNLNLVKGLNTVKETAKFLGLSPGSVSKYLAEATSFELNNTCGFKFKKGCRVYKKQL